MILDNHGVHEIGLDYCGCAGEVEKHIQLLRIAWYPATITDPKTAATFRFLESFHLLTFESKVSCFQQWRGILRQQENTGTKSVPVSNPLLPPSSLPNAHWNK